MPGMLGLLWEEMACSLNMVPWSVKGDNRRGSRDKIAKMQKCAIGLGRDGLYSEHGPMARKGGQWTWLQGHGSRVVRRSTSAVYRVAYGSSNAYFVIGAEHLRALISFPRKSRLRYTFRVHNVEEPQKHGGSHKCRVAATEIPF